jgi:undecaprenyl-diphosphatase
MTSLEAFLLGIIQGLTEFLPVSSSGHLEIGNVLLGVTTSENLLFAVVVHAATALSTIVIYRKDIWQIIVDLFAFRWNESTQFVVKIFLSMIPVGIVGVFFESEVEAFFSGNMLLVGCMLLVTATLLFFTHHAKSNDGEVTFGKSIIIGLAQAFAIMPGISRSGSTIATALLLGVDKAKAARFSFLMVLIPILGAGFLKLLDYLETSTVSPGISPIALMIGFIAAFGSGLLACQWMISIVKKGKLTYFAYYCAAVGLVAIITSWL